MKKIGTQKKILDAATEILKTQDTENFHMRNIAKESGIALGTTYNYFKNKDEIILALAEDFWRKALILVGKEMETKRDVLSQIEHMFLTLYKEFSNFASDLLKLLSGIQSKDKKIGLEREKMVFKEMEDKIYAILEEDEISPDIWTEIFTKNQMSQFIIGGFMQAISRREKNIDYLLEILRRLLLEGSY